MPLGIAALSSPRLSSEHKQSPRGSFQKHSSPTRRSRKSPDRRDTSTTATTTGGMEQPVCDTSIHRGAEIIRREILQKRWPEQGQDRSTAVVNNGRRQRSANGSPRRSSPTSSPRTQVSGESSAEIHEESYQLHSFGDDDFSDPWKYDVSLEQSSSDEARIEVSPPQSAWKERRGRDESVALNCIADGDRSWGELSSVQYSDSPQKDSPMKRCSDPSADQIPPPPDEETGGTPVTSIGRGRKLRAKAVTYLVEDITDPNYRKEWEETDDDSDIMSVSESANFTYSSGENSSPRKLRQEGLREPVPRGDTPVQTVQKTYFPLQEEKKLDDCPTMCKDDEPKKNFRSGWTYLPKFLRTEYLPETPETKPKMNREVSLFEHTLTDDELTKEESTLLEATFEETASPSSVPGLSTLSGDVDLTYVNIPSPVGVDYAMLMQDPAFAHAQKAGFLWQSLVGQHVRFPSSWWNGARSPPMGVARHQKWQYFGRHTVKKNDILNRLVRSRASGGRLLLHIIVQDMMNGTPVEDIAIGCFHPNAHGIRNGVKASRKLEDCRDLWLGVRRRTNAAVSAIDSLLVQTQAWGEVGCKTPLGRDERVTNDNVRAVFGDKPPMETIFLSESELYERLAPRVLTEGISPPLAILQEFVFA